MAYLNEGNMELDEKALFLVLLLAILMKRKWLFLIILGTILCLISAFGGLPLIVVIYEIEFRIIILIIGIIKIISGLFIMIYKEFNPDVGVHRMRGK